MTEARRRDATLTQAAADAGRRGRTRIAGRSGRCRWRSTTCGRGSRGVPVSDLYGARLRDQVRAYASSRGYLGGLSPEAAWTDEAATTWDDGFRAMKLRIGRYPVDEEIDGDRAGRRRPAPPMTWMADGNGAYDLDESRRLGAALEALGFRWLEEPLPTDDYRPMRRWPASCRSRWPAARSSSRPRTPSRTCGPARSTSSSPTSRSAAGSAASSRSRPRPRDAGRFAVPHACSGAIALAATLHILAVLPVPPDAPTWAEPILEHDVGENPIRTDILTEPLTLDDGWMTIPDGPGLGIEVDEVALRRLVA